MPHDGPHHDHGIPGRPNPMAWTGEEPATGVFVGTDLDDLQLNLIGAPSLAAIRRERRLLDPDTRPSATLRQRLDTLLAALRSATPTTIRVDDLSEQDRAFLADLLGEGEVTIVAGHDPLWQVHESVMTGLWRVRATDADGTLARDVVEVGDIPALVREAAAGYGAPMRPMPNDIEDGVMNAPSVLAEIAERAASWVPGGRNHVVNFTLLPMTEQDIRLLTTMLGQAPLTIVSGGYGTARVYMTGVKNVWAVQYLNAAGAVILDTIEIGDVPESVRATGDDFADSAMRFSEILEQVA